MICLRPADGVLVGACTAGAGLRARAAHPLDARQAADLPAWRAQEYLAARALLRRLIATVDEGGAEEPIAVRDGGQPHLPGRPELAVSLSHTRGYVAAAVGVGREVGVDVQAADSGASEALVRRCCTPRGAARLLGVGASERTLELCWIWTVQEACVKAAGSGLRGRPWAIPVEPGQPAGRWGPYRWRALREDSAVPLSCAWGPARAGPRHRASVSAALPAALQPCQ